MDDQNNEFTSTPDDFQNEPINFMDLLEDLHSDDINVRQNALSAIQKNNIRDERLTLAVQGIALDDESSRLQSIAYDILREWDAVPSQVEFDLLLNIEEDTSDREILLRTLRALQAQQKLLEDTQNKVGCLYQYMIASIVLAVLSVILSFMF